MRLFGQSVTGWRVPAIAAVILVWTMTAVLWGLLVYSFVRGIRRTGSVQDQPVFYSNDCERTRVLLVFLRFLISALSTLVLVSSYYFMQILVAPTREDIDKAHGRSQWMDIGVPSTRNLRFISCRRSVLWLLLAVIWVPFHLLSNSCVFGIVPAVPWVTVLATESFVSGGDYYLPGIGMGPPREDKRLPYTERFNISVPEEVKYIADNAAKWERLSARECLHAYDVWINVHKRRHMVAVVSMTNDDDDDEKGGWTTSDKSRSWGKGTYNDTAYSVWYAGHCGLYANNERTLCGGLAYGLNISLWDGDGPYNNVSIISEDANSMMSLVELWQGSWMDKLVDEHDNWVIPWHAVTAPGGATLLNETLTVSYCLSERIEANCKARINNMLFLAVGLVALGKSVLCAVVIRHLWATQPLATIGDAVDSFIRQPDPTTRGMCTLGWQDFSKKRPGRPRKPSANGWAAAPRRWKTQRARWGDSVYRSDWAVAYIPGIAGFILACLALKSFVEGVGGWKLAYFQSTFGQDPQNPVFILNYPSEKLRRFVLRLASDRTGVLLLVHFPQVGLASMALFLNVIYTRMLMAREWASYSVGLKTLRVSEPRGKQRRTHFLEIPWRYAVAVQVLGILVRWLCANAMYTVNVEPPQDGVVNRYENFRYFNILLSFRAALGTVIAFFIMMVTPLILACFRLPGEAVMVGSCSAAISAACHVLRPCSPLKEETEPAGADFISRWDSSSTLLEREASVLISATDAEGGDGGNGWRGKMAEGKLRWGGCLW
nr:uncharacterized protein CTRU02_02574 [Colletotrichum truncatum]KAF6798600.1 hypothetical protein CTRU02_02574 [Colletotrichum truncatum]